MNSPDKDWWIEQSGEYVLGTLNHAEWLTFRKAAKHDERAQRLIAEWEQTFQPLADSLQPVQPPSSVWDAIDVRISASTNATVDSSISLGSTNSESVVDLNKYKVNEDRLEAKLGRWRSFAGLATAASILLASLAWINYSVVQELSPVEPIAGVTQFDSIAIIRDAQSLPLWIVDTALTEGLVRVTAIAPPAIDNSQSYQLWLVKPDDAGVQSMGLIPTTNDASYLLNVQADSENPVAFAVSLEPSGGSTEDGPTGPVLFQGVVQNLKI